MITTGIDIIEIGRIEKIVKTYTNRFLNRIYTQEELSYCKGRYPQLAARFAAKEAVMKALGTGTRGIGWQDIEIIRTPGNPPEVLLHSRAAKRAHTIQITQFALSLSHSREYAVASVIAFNNDSSSD
tara:strand:+ start:48 stop:428 length:381 start_codon:yes stop_codon:yes gene_type:complete